MMNYGSIKQKTMLTAGDRAPEFELEICRQSTHSLRYLHKNPVVLAFSK